MDPSLLAGAMGVKENPLNESLKFLLALCGRRGLSPYPDVIPRLGHSQATTHHDDRVVSFSPGGRST